MIPKIIIEVNGGVAEVTAVDRTIQVMLVDWDNVKAGDHDLPVFVYEDCQGSDVFDAKVKEVRDEVERIKNKNSK